MCQLICWLLVFYFTLTYACDAGYYMDNDQCTPCPAGTYKSLPGNTTFCELCTFCHNNATQTNACPKGSASNPVICECNKGFTGDGVSCTICPAGSYKSVVANICCGRCKTCHPNATTLTPCTIGSQSNSVTCQCNAGFYGDGFSCTSCPVGTYKSFIGNSNYCPNCSSCHPNASLISTCPIGSTTDNKVCVCNSGYYGDGISCSTCKSCPVNSYQLITCSTNSNFDTVSCACYAGYYFNQTQNNCTLCKECPIHSYQTSLCPIGSWSDITTCACNTGYYGDGTSCKPCRTCPSNSFATTLCATDSHYDTTSCACNVGYYGNGWNCTLCPNCPENASPNKLCDPASSTNTITCSCNIGYYGDGTNCQPCKTCPTDTIMISTCSPNSQNDTTLCSCKSNYYGNGVICYPCQSCPLYSTTKTQCYPGTLWDTTTCTCNAGYYSNETDITICTPCKTCPTNSYQTTTCPVGSTSDTVSCSCNADYYMNNSICEPCRTCLNGSYPITTCLLNSTSDTTLCACGVGYYYNQSTCTKCKTCPLHSYQLITCAAGSQSDTTLCACEAGYFLNGSDCQECKKCPPNSPAMSLCAPGSFYDSVVCTCAPNYFFNGTDCQECKKCPNNTSPLTTCYSGLTYDTTTCACDIGYYGTNCTPCPLPPSNAVLQRTCTSTQPIDFICNAGYYKQSNECVLCTICHPHATVTTNCPFNSTNDTSQCTCNAGYTGNGFICIPCLPGTYKSVLGPQNCYPCSECPNNSITTTYCTIASIEDAVKCECLPGFLCGNIPYPLSRRLPGILSDAVIAICNAGFYQTSQECVPCVTGTYNPMTDKQECPYCPAGTYNPYTNATFCTSCITGTYNPHIGVNSSTFCISCELGYVPDSLQSSCISCDQGQVCVPYTSPPIACTSNRLLRCDGSTAIANPYYLSFFHGVLGVYINNQLYPNKTYQSILESYTAYSILCPPNTFCAIDNNKQCMRSKPQDNVSQAYGLVIGTPQPHWLLFKTITSANEGYGFIYSTEVQPTDDIICWLYNRPCQEGYVLVGAQCMACPFGTFYNNPTYECIPCNQGYYSNTYGAIACTICPSNYYQPDLKASQCIPCPINTLSKPGSSACSDLSYIIQENPCTTLCNDTFRFTDGFSKMTDKLADYQWSIPYAVFPPQLTLDFSLGNPQWFEDYDVYNPQLYIARTKLPPNHKTPWIATVTIRHKQTFREYINIIGNVLLLQTNYMQYDEGILTIDAYYIYTLSKYNVETQVKVYSGNEITLQIYHMDNPILQLRYVLFRNITTEVTSTQVINTLLPMSYQSGSRATLLVWAEYGSNCWIQLLPSDPSISTIIYDSDITVEPLKNYGWTVSIDPYSVPYEGNLFRFQVNTNVFFYVNAKVDVISPKSLQICCNGSIVTSSDFSAAQFYPSEVIITPIILTYVDTSTTLVLANDAFMTVIPCAPYVSFEAATNKLKVNSIAFYKPNIQCSIIFEYSIPKQLQPIQSIIQLILTDVTSFQVDTVFPAGTPFDQRVLKQIHCMGIYQRVQLKPWVHFDIQTTAEIHSKIRFTSSSSTTLQIQQDDAKKFWGVGINPGIVSITAEWSGYFLRIPDITIVSESVLLENVYADDLYISDTFNTSHKLSLYANIPFDYSFNLLDSLLFIPFITITTPDQNVQLKKPWIYILTNTYQEKQIIFSLPPCMSNTISVTINLVVNLVPSDNDVDIGNLGGELAITDNMTEIPIHLQAIQTQVFWITLTIYNQVTDCILNNTLFEFVTCTINDPAYRVSILGIAPMGQPITSLTELVLLQITDPPLKGITGFVYIYNNDTTTFLNITAAVWKPFNHTWVYTIDYPKLVWNLQDAVEFQENDKTTMAHNVLLLLANKWRYVEDTIIFATNFELSLLVRLLDMYGNDIEDNTIVTILITGDPAVPDLQYATILNNVTTIPGFYQYDGWWGQQYREKIPLAWLTVTFQIQTLDALSQTQADRQYELQSTFRVESQRRRLLSPQSFIQLHMQANFPHIYHTYDYVVKTGNIQYPCPRIAHTEGHVIVKFLATTTINTNQIACKLNVPPQRVSLETNAKNQYILQVQVESLLRALDIRIMLPEMKKIYQTYKFSPQDPETPCPSNKYYNIEQGRYLLLPSHSQMVRECYDFECLPLFVRVNDECVPQDRDYYWTVIIFILCMILFWGLVIVCAASFLETGMNVKETDEEEFASIDDNDVLPIAVTEDGELEYQLEVESVSSLSSELQYSISESSLSDDDL